jgi:hypothetical protein
MDALRCATTSFCNFSFSSCLSLWLLSAPSAHSSCLDLPFRVYYGIEGLGVGMVASVGNAFQAYGL